MTQRLPCVTCGERLKAADRKEWARTIRETKAEQKEILKQDSRNKDRSKFDEQASERGHRIKTV